MPLPLRSPFRVGHGTDTRGDGVMLIMRHATLNNGRPGDIRFESSSGGVTAVLLDGLFGGARELDGWNTIKWRCQWLIRSRRSLV